VTNLKNHKTVIVRINDRGAFSKKRIIDLSKAAACRIDLVRAGVAMVKIEVVGNEDSQSGKEKKSFEIDTTILYNILNDLKSGNIYNTNGKVTSISGYTIQLASLQQVDHIAEIVQSLQKDYIKEIYIDVRIVEKKKIYRVLIGDCSQIEAAQKEMKKLKKAGYNGFIKKIKVR
jgi:rare lipoprotein A